MKGTKKPQKKKKPVIDPPAGISKNGKDTCVVCQLPGVPEESIRIYLDRTRLVISASGKDGDIIKKIEVPEGSRISSKKYRDCILELILEEPG